MQEVDLENMLARYPELIEPRLTLIDRQHCINRKRVDLLYSDSTGRTLVVEVKVGALCRTDIGQLSEYCHYFFQRDGTRPRGMLVGTRVPDEIRGAAGFNGFECISLSLGTLEKHMRERNDQEMLSAVRVSRSSTSGSESHEVAPNTEHRGFWSRVLGRWAAVNTTSPTPRTYAGAKPSIADMLRSVLSEVAKGAILSAHEINSAVLDAFPGTPKSSILISDRCYNITNRGLSANYDFRIFEFIDRATYCYLGEGCPYSGHVTWNGQRCGLWTNGVLEKWDNWPARGPLQAVETRG